MKKANQAPGYYPMFLNVTGKRCVVVGGGTVALRKVKGLLAHGASLEVISPSACSELSELAETRLISLKCRRYKPGDLVGAFVVIAATTDSKTNQEVASEARRRKTLVNVVDRPEESDFIVPACLCRGDLTIAVSTAGKSPALARKIRTRLEKNFGDEYASLTDLIGEVRAELRQRSVTVSGDDWQKALDIDLLVKLLRDGQREKAKATLLSNLETSATENI